MIKLKCLFCSTILKRLDIGEGRELNLEKCRPTKLYTQCIKYLGQVRFPKLLLASPY
ncbi:hypothetical protein Lalb_Chr04g0260621 [Lupinus albus]|uniref:Uncharacterized protein n=1 Tax=Lupinus albus TaxID=3870 RepID=A0A6A4QNI5_LUPAL|nr:hypothetical protein Lalb_Chr04g0260621 [Lupinus albus]